MQGLAADILCPAFGPPLEVCRAIATSGIGTDQVIHEFGRWRHVAFPSPGRVARKELLIIRSVATGLELGLRNVGEFPSSQARQLNRSWRAGVARSASPIG
jgi:hypothetical protein